MLWETVARTARPLRGGPLSRPAEEADTSMESTPSPGAALGPAEPVGAPAAERPLEPLDRRLRTRLGRGAAPIEGRLDLHGLTQREAHATLKRFLTEAQRRRARVVLVITGKGRPEAGPSIFEDARGVLRRAVPQWLAAPEFRPFVAGFDEAHRSHGGAGALYVRVRRPRGEAP